MRVNTQTNIKSTGSLGGERVALTVDVNNMAFIMSVLTDLYSDPELAAIREYATNAHDSHLAAGTERPIEVTLPSLFNPTYVVEDWGVGLSTDELKEVYTKYGLSTKRDNDDESGMLGLGCKSALTYTPQFSIQAVKDGVLTHAVVNRAESGEGGLEIVNTQPTTKPNGVKISIPVADPTTFSERAKTFFSNWKAGSVLVDGKQPENDLTKIDDDTYLGGSDYQIVMGNITYDVDFHKVFGSWYNWSGIDTNFRWVAHVPMGSVNFTPSREALHYTDLTKEFLIELGKSVTDKITAYIQKQMDVIETYTELSEWMNRSSLQPHVLRGMNLNFLGVRFSDYIDGSDYLSLSYEPNKTRYKKNNYTSITTSEIRNVVFVTDLDEDFTAYRSRKFSIWYDEWDEQARRFLFVKNGKTLPKELGDVRTVSWKEIDKVKVTNNKSTGPRNTGPKDVFKVMSKGDGYMWKERKIDPSIDKAVIFISPSMLKRPHVTSEWSKSVLAVFDASVVILGKNRWDKFKRDYGVGMTLQEALDALPDGHIIIPKESTYNREDWFDMAYLFSGLDSTKIEDPQVIEMIDAYNAYTNYDPSFHVKRLANWFELDIPVNLIGREKCDLKFDTEKYEFMNYMRRPWSTEKEKYNRAVINLINAAYQSAKEDN